MSALNNACSRTCVIVNLVGSLLSDDKCARDQLEEKLKKAQHKRELKASGEERERKKSRLKNVFVAGRGSTVLTETEELDSINYRPKTKQSRCVQHANDTERWPHVLKFVLLR